MSEKTMLVFGNKNLYFFKDIDLEDIEVTQYYKNCTNILSRGLRFLAKKLGNYYLAFDSWKKKNENKKYILFDYGLDKKILDFFVKNGNNQNVFIYFWNPIRRKEQLELIEYAKKNSLKVYTYDSEDSIEYSLNFNSIFYYLPQEFKVKTESECKYDFIFVGLCKDRGNEIFSIYDSLKEKYNLFFYVVTDDTLLLEQYPEICHKKYLSYDKYIEKLNDSKIIVDLVQKGQTGISLRGMEALFLEKKILTNNKSYLKTNVLAKDVVYIYEDEMRGIEEFVLREKNKSSYEMKEYYSIQEWIKRFGKDS